jgi:hypothetical protein
MPAFAQNDESAYFTSRGIAISDSVISGAQSGHQRAFIRALTRAERSGRAVSEKEEETVIDGLPRHPSISR